MEFKKTYKSLKRVNQKLIPLSMQFVKFGIIGVTNTLISLSVYYLLIGVNVQYIIAYTMGFLISVVNAYYWNRRYVFKSYSQRQIFAFLRSIMSYFSTFCVGSVLLFVMVNDFGISNRIAPIINLAFTIPANFILNKIWVFR